MILGGIIGWERRQADRPAGIRTMSLVSLGSSLFTIDSTFAFADGSQTWDASRVSAAIPSGVGFLGKDVVTYKPFLLRAALLCLLFVFFSSLFSQLAVYYYC